MQRKYDRILDILVIIRRDIKLIRNRGACCIGIFFFFKELVDFGVVFSGDDDLIVGLLAAFRYGDGNGLYELGIIVLICLAELYDISVEVKVIRDTVARLIVFRAVISKAVLVRGHGDLCRKLDFRINQDAVNIALNSYGVLGLGRIESLKDLL